MDDEIPPGFTPFLPFGAFGRHNGSYFEKQEGPRVVRAFRVAEHHLNSAGVVSGGMLTSFLDLVLARVAAPPGSARSTVRLVTDFLGPAKLADWIEGEGELVRRTETLAFVNGLLRVGRRPIARASGIFRVDHPRL